MSTFLIVHNVTCFRLYTGFGLALVFTELLQLVTASEDYAITVLHTSEITIGHPRSSQAVIVFTSRCLVAACNVGRSPSSGFPNDPPCPSYQLLAATDLGL
jgi:hypothetical protein